MSKKIIIIISSITVFCIIIIVFSFYKFNAIKSVVVDYKPKQQKLLPETTPDLNTKNIKDVEAEIIANTPEEKKKNITVAKQEIDTKGLDNYSLSKLNDNHNALNNAFVFKPYGYLTVTNTENTSTAIDITSKLKGTKYEKRFNLYNSFLGKQVDEVEQILREEQILEPKGFKENWDNEPIVYFTNPRNSSFFSVINNKENKVVGISFDLYYLTEKQTETPEDFQNYEKDEQIYGLSKEINEPDITIYDRINLDKGARVKYYKNAKIVQCEFGQFIVSENFDLSLLDDFATYSRFLKGGEFKNYPVTK
jgi:hypothetical protein